MIGVEGPLQLLLVVQRDHCHAGLHAGTMNYFYTRNRFYESIALLLVAFTLFRPGFWMDMVAPQYVVRPASEVMDLSKRRHPIPFLRIAVAGFDPVTFEDSLKTVMLNLGPQAEAQQRLLHAGLMVLRGQPLHACVIEGTDASRFGIASGWEVENLLVPNPDRPPKELFFIPALLLLGLVYLLQKRRLNAANPLPSRARA